jgi:hypothetical protein
MAKLPRPAPMGPIDYASPTPPPQYHCSKCGVHGVKLWRETFAISRFFAGPVRARSNPCPGTLILSRRSASGACARDAKRIYTTDDGSSYWGYSSAPIRGVTWWCRLRLRLENPA